LFVVISAAQNIRTYSKWQATQIILVLDTQYIMEKKIIMSLH